MATVTDLAAPRTAGKAALDPLDLYDIRGALTDEERMVQDAVARLVDEKVLPVIQKHFEEHTFPRDLVPEIAALGLLGSSLDGLRLRRHECRVLRPDLPGTRARRLGHPQLRLGAVEPVHVPDPRLRQRGAEGEIPAAHGDGRADRLLRPDRAARRLRSRQHEDAREAPRQDWVLNGAKMWITNAPIADLAIVWAKTEEGIRGFIVEKGMRGFAAPEIERKFSLRASATGALYFEDVVVPEENVLPGSTIGLKAPLSCLTQARFGITWGVIGAAQACLAQLLDYTQTRVLFGRPLAANQAIQIRLAEMARGITGAQLMSLQLGRLKDAGRMHPAQVSLAKWNNCRMALDVARDARDMLGGSGISAEYVPIRHALNLESVITYEGTETIHQLTIGRELTGINAF